MVYGSRGSGDPLVWVKPFKTLSASSHMAALNFTISFDGPELRPITTHIEFLDQEETSVGMEPWAVNEAEVSEQLISSPSVFGLTDVLRTKIREFPRLHSLVVAMEGRTSSMTQALERVADHKARLSSVVRKKGEAVATIAQVRC
jgi:hypothetical protein